MGKRRVCWLIWCAMLGVLYLFENNTASRMLLVCSLVLPFIDWVMVTVAMRHLRFRMELPEQAEKNSDIPIEVHVDGTVPMVRFFAELQSENRLTDETVQYASWVRQTACSYLMQTEHCGMLHLRLKLTVSGLLGLFERTAGENRQGVVWVLPTVEPVQIVLREDGALQEGNTVATRRPWQDVSDSSGIREYVPGDPVRMIHWKLSEKMDTLMLREDAYAVSEQLLLAVDCSSAVDGEAVSDMTEMLFSISHALLDNGIPHGVLWHPASAVQPELRRIESPMEQAAFETDYFSVTPHRSLPLAATEAAQQYAHVVLIGNTSLLQSFDGSMTHITTRADLTEPIMI
ncbi:MAG: DUF58 domain-containing protein [Aristaeellaceae bacterium]